MFRSPLLRIAAAAAALWLSAAPASAGVAVAPSFSGLYVLGDSLSDSGRVFAATAGTFPPSPYFNGRFSNGPVAVEYLATGLGLTPGQVFNLAWGGAETGLNGNFSAGTGMLSQLAEFQGLLTGPADPTALYFVWGGANDLRNGVAIGTAVGNLSTIVSDLYGLGARNFLLPNLPDLGLTPSAREAGGGVPAQATSDSEAFNTALSAAYGVLAGDLAGEVFYHFDAMAAQRAITLGSPGNGFDNVTERCFDTRNPAAITLCAAPSTYLYWDNIHPTAAAHQILGGQMLAAVPEPATWLMMAVGALGLIGLGRRRQA